MPSQDDGRPVKININLRISEVGQSFHTKRHLVVALQFTLRPYSGCVNVQAYLIVYFSWS